MLVKKGSEGKMMRVFSRNSLFSRGTTFESSTCDYSDDLQILLESEEGGVKKTEQMIL